MRASSKPGSRSYLAATWCGLPDLARYLILRHPRLTLSETMIPDTTSNVGNTMQTRLASSLERARRGDGPSVGQWLELPGYSLARTVAPLGEDVCKRVLMRRELCLLTTFLHKWVLIDTEHGNIDDNEMYLQVGAISSSGISPIIRIPGSEHWMIKRALDCGAHAVMVPMCETKVSIKRLCNS